MAAVRFDQVQDDVSDHHQIEDSGDTEKRVDGPMRRQILVNRLDDEKEINADNDHRQNGQQDFIKSVKKIFISILINNRL